jgi:hypothetical protein
MRFRDLVEAESKHVSFCFGRMNPPTIGHEQVFDTLKSLGGDFRIYLSQSQDKKKNPLDYGTKVKFIKLMFPQFAGNVIEDTNLNTIGKVCSSLYDQGYRNITLVAGDDRLPAMKKLIEDYNGVEGKAHGFYKFDVIDGKSSGARDPDADGVAGISASGARAAAANGNLDEFAEATGAGQYAEELYKAVRAGMGLKESVSESPIELDRNEPMNPMIYGHDKANPAKLQYRMMRAAGQLKDLAQRAENASPYEWQTITKHFEELSMNIEQIRHALEELSKVKSKGGIKSRGITV